MNCEHIIHLLMKDFICFIEKHGPSQEGRSRDSFILDDVSFDAWPITLLISMAAVERLIYVTWSPIHYRLSQLHLFPVILLTPSPLPIGSGHQNTNDVLDKWSISWQLQHLSPWQSCPQRWPSHSFWETLPPPWLCLDLGGDVELVGSCGCVYVCGGVGVSHFVQ